MTEQRNVLAELIRACSKDEALKARFISDPKAVLAERGIDISDGMNVNVLENSEHHLHITMPPAPAGHNLLSEEELNAAAGGYACYANIMMHG